MKSCQRRRKLVLRLVSTVSTESLSALWLPTEGWKSKRFVILKRLPTMRPTRWRLALTPSGRLMKKWPPKRPKQE